MRGDFLSCPILLPLGPSWQLAMGLALQALCHACGCWSILKLLAPGATPSRPPRWHCVPCMLCSAPGLSAHNLNERHHEPFGGSTWPPAVTGELLPGGRLSTFVFHTARPR